MTTSIETQISAHQANVDLLNRYAHAMDNRTWPALAALFTEDGVFSARRLPHSGATNLPQEPDLSLKGPAKISQFMGAMLDTMRATHYLLSNYVIDLDSDGNKAAGSCYFRAYHVGKDERAHLHEESLGRFDMTTVRAGSQWKFTWLEEKNMISLGTQEAWGAHPYLDFMAQETKKTYADAISKDARQ